LPRSKRNTAPDDPVTDYARNVTSGALVAGRIVRLSAQRHLDDLTHASSRGLRFDAGRARQAIDFFREFLRHPDGAPFVLAPFQEFLVGSIFGWRLGDVRRFHHLILLTGKGNGKSPLAAGLALSVLFLDAEPGAELYCAAVTREQARIQFGDCLRMAKASPDLARQLDMTDNNIAMPSTGSFIRPVSSEARALDGKRVSVALVDELMEHQTADVYDKMRAGVKARRQPLIVVCTNSGYDKHSVAWRLYDYSIKVLEGTHTNDSWLSYIAQLDPCPACAAAGHGQPNEECATCDDWTDEATWPKANPLLDAGLPRTYLRGLVEEALAMPSKRAHVQRLCFSLWTSASVRWIPTETWKACGRPLDPATLAGQSCVAGIDLGEVRDMTALVLLFGDAEQGYTILPYFFAAEEVIRARAHRDRLPYDQWVTDGFLEATPGDAVDTAYLKARLLKMKRVFDIREVAFDPWHSRQLGADLIAAGIPAVEVPSTSAHIAPAAKELERLLLSRRIRHGNHPVLDWHISNAVAKLDAVGNIHPTKDKAGELIDGVDALLTALARATEAPPASESVYDQRLARGEPVLTVL
jgi:phage terminase large subunit-like protein